MKKQQKVLNKIKYSTDSGHTTPLGTKPNDECYTSMKDILAELSQWAALGKFQGKNIICPCDWDIVEGEDIYSITIEYDPDFKVTGNNVIQAVKHVQVGLFDHFLEGETVLRSVEISEVEVENFLRNKLTCNFVRTLTQNARAWGIKSITASGYNPATGKGIKFQKVDYSKYDICITNPPFSLYREFMNCVVGKIDFILLAPFLKRGTPSIGLPLMLRRAYLGFGIQMTKMTFDNPTRKNQYKTKIVACDWITSFSEAQEERNLRWRYHKSRISYEDYKDEYLVVDGMTMKDGTHPIRVPSTQFPDDYQGWMFASATVLDRLDYDTFEWYGTSFKKYYNQINAEASPFQHRCTDGMRNAQGKNLFDGIVFRRKMNK